MKQSQPELDRRINIRLDSEFMDYLNEVALQNNLKLSTFSRRVLMQNTYKYQPDPLEAGIR